MAPRDPPLDPPLLSFLFTQDELSKGNCSKPMRFDIEQLNAERLWPIKCNLCYIFTCGVLHTFLP